MTEEVRRPWLGRVSVRFAVAIAVALLPLGAVVIYQTNVLQSEVARRSDAALAGQVLREASGQVDAILRVRGMAAALAKAVPLLVDNTSACSSIMRGVATNVPQSTIVAYVPRSGQMTCSSSGQTYDYSASPLFKQLIAQKEPDFMVVPAAPVSKTSILGISHPVYSLAGDYLGYIFIALSHDRLETLEGTADPAEIPSVSYWTFDSSGEVLSSTVALDAVRRQLPSRQKLSDLTGQTYEVFRDISVSGISQTYSVVPLVPGELYLMGSWNVVQPTWLARNGLEPYVMPFLMWAVGMIVAGWAGEVMVTRHLRVLNQSITRFAKGDRRLISPDMTHAPVEFREIGDAYLGMTDAIMRGEAELEDSVHQKDVLLREVHHRVKNNLQLIASIMNMQMRKAHSPEARGLLKGLQDRVMSLATIHRGLYQTSGLVDVRADELLGDLVRQIVNMSSGPDRKLDVVTDLDDMLLTPDQTVPLSLLLTEALTNAIKYAGNPKGIGPRIEVSLKREGGSGAALEVRNEVGKAGAEANLTSTGLGGALITAFAQQLGGRLEQTSEDGTYRLRVEFKVIPLGQAEEAAPAA